MFKNKTVLFIALCAALGAVLCALLLHFSHFKNNFTPLIVSLLFFFLLFFGLAYFLNRNIYKRTQLDEVDQEIKKWTREKQPLIRQLRAQEKFRQEFISDVAHELKTPIFNIQGYIYTLIDGGLYDEKINKKYLRKAQKNINRMIRMVEDLDLITQLESGELTVIKKRFSLHQIIEEAIEEVELRAMEKDITIRYKRPKEELWAYAEKEHILRVLINLISNSVKYGKKTGQTEISVNQQASSDRYLIKVTDNGIGIKKEDLLHIFARFYRVDKSRSRNEGGSGLGLSIVKHILEVHGETISVESTFGEGATFQFSILKSN